MHFSRAVIACCAAAAPLVPLTGSAQQPAGAWRARVELGFNGSSGNSSFSILRTGGSVTRLSTEIYELELSTLIRYGKSDEKEIANDQRVTMKFDWHPDADFSPFTFVTGSRDRIRKIDLKVNGGVGAKWTFLRYSGGKASVSLAGIIDYEDLELAAASTAEEARSVGRWSGRFKFDHEFGTGAAFQHITFWQPQIGKFADYLIEVSNSLSTRLLTNLSLVIQHEYLHDEVPPEGVQADDHKFSVVLRVAL